MSIEDINGILKNTDSVLPTVPPTPIKKGLGGRKKKQRVTGHGKHQDLRLSFKRLHNYIKCT